MSFKKYGSNYLKGVRDYRVTSGVTSECISHYLEALDCPRSLTVFMLWKYKEHEQLASLEFNPDSYDSYLSCRDAYAATKFLSKYKDLSLGYDLDEVALEKFKKFELLCKHTNSRFRNPLSDPKYSGRNVWLHHAVKRKIERILGEFDPHEFFEMPDWGPGASTLIKRRFASSANKFQCETGITRELHSLIPDDLLRAVYPLWGSHLLDIGFPNYQAGNRVVTVPKDAKANRVIAIEPGINLWFQKSLGDMIGRRLRRYGVDLRWQSRNQELARAGSINNRLATIDLSSASDSISLEVVREFIPPRWFSVMDSCRSHYGRLGTELIKWEKFSSMGNGFTFQLESLIFYAVALCCAEFLRLDSFEVKGVSAYGDDVILPSACFDIFSGMLDYLGFQINESKSHYDSPFRESCGAHYYQGSDLKPIYLKDKLSTVQSVYRLANAVRRLARRRQSFGCDERLRTVFERLVHLVPSALRLRIPDGIGDGGFISNFDEATPRKARHWIEGYFVNALAEVGKTYQEDRVGFLLSRLWAMPESAVPIDWGAGSRTRTEAITSLTSRDSAVGSANAVPLVGSVKLRVVNVLVQQWCDLGPWV